MENRPNHYQGSNGIETIDVLNGFMTLEQVKGFLIGNIIKYVLRHQKKNGVEDLKKAKQYIDWLIEGSVHES